MLKSRIVACTTEVSTSVIPARESAFDVDLSNSREFVGGVYYKQAFDSDTAYNLGSLAMIIQGDPNDICFYEPNFRTDSGAILPRPLIRKAWLSKSAGQGYLPPNMPGQKLLPAYGTYAQRSLGLVLEQAVCSLDTTLGQRSDYSYIQDYKPRATLGRHKDEGSVSRHLSLDGDGIFKTYDDESYRVLHEQPVSPGDLVVSYGDTYHSFSAGESGRMALSSVYILPPDNL